MATHQNHFCVGRLTALGSAATTAGKSSDLGRSREVEQFCAAILIGFADEP